MKPHCLLTLTLSLATLPQLAKSQTTHVILFGQRYSLANIQIEDTTVPFAKVRYALPAQVRQPSPTLTTPRTQYTLLYRMSAAAAKKRDQLIAQLAATSPLSAETIAAHLQIGRPLTPKTPLTQRTQLAHDTHLSLLYALAAFEAVHPNMTPPLPPPP